MDINLFVGAAGLIIGIAGILIALVLHRRTRREKRIVYEVLPPVSIAEVTAPRNRHKLAIMYQKEGEPPREVQKAVVHFLRLSNFGRDPIRREDVSTRDPLRVEVSGGEVLDMALVATSREVINMALQVDQKTSVASALLTFDFLDLGDGGMIQIITDSPDSEIRLHGSVIGMPKGLLETTDSSQGIYVGGWGCVPSVLLQLAAIVAVPFIYKNLTGSWTNVTLLLLPAAALILPFGLALLAIMLLSPRGRFHFSDLLSPPPWYEHRLHLHRRHAAATNRETRVREREKRTAA